MPTEAEEIIAVFERANFPAKTYVDALNSEQATFDPVEEPAEGELGYITRVTGAPAQVAGRLGRDGLWRVAVYLLPANSEGALRAEVHAAEVMDRETTTIVLVDGSIAERMVKDAIPKLLAGLAQGEVREAFVRRLAQSRFAITIH